MKVPTLAVSIQANSISAPKDVEMIQQLLSHLNVLTNSGGFKLSEGQRAKEKGHQCAESHFFFFFYHRCYTENCSILPRDSY